MGTVTGTNWLGGLEEGGLMYRNVFDWVLGMVWTYGLLCGLWETLEDHLDIGEWVISPAECCGCMAWYKCVLLVLKDILKLYGEGVKCIGMFLLGMGYTTDVMGYPGGF